MLFVVTGLIVTRLYVRTKLLKSSWILSDYLLLTAYTFAFAHCVCDLLMFKYGILNRNYSHTAPVFPLDPVKTVRIFKVSLCLVASRICFNYIL